VEASVSGGNPLPPLEFLAAGLAAALPLSPLVCAVALRLNIR
jgi:hypothetical protein